MARIFRVFSYNNDTCPSPSVNVRVLRQINRGYSLVCIIFRMTVPSVTIFHPYFFHLNFVPILERNIASVGGIQHPIDSNTFICQEV
jgi:hypothetical protein